MKIFLVPLVSLFLFFSCTDSKKEPDIVINIKVSNEGYKPSQITVPRGKTVLFRITALDTPVNAGYPPEYSGHCFYIMPPYNIMVKNIKRNQTKEVKVHMIFPGKFIFTCPYCSGIYPLKGEIYVR